MLNTTAIRRFGRTGTVKLSARAVLSSSVSGIPTSQTDPGVSNSKTFFLRIGRRHNPPPKHRRLICFLVEKSGPSCRAFPFLTRYRTTLFAIETRMSNSVRPTSQRAALCTAEFNRHWRFGSCAELKPVQQAVTAIFVNTALIRCSTWRSTHLADPGPRHPSKRRARKAVPSSTIAVCRKGGGRIHRSEAARTSNRSEVAQTNNRSEVARTSSRSEFGIEWSA